MNCELGIYTRFLLKFNNKIYDKVIAAINVMDVLIRIRFIELKLEILL